jgi:hypothetical protein
MLCANLFYHFTIFRLCLEKIVSRSHLLAAAHQAILSAAQGDLHTQTVHSEVISHLNPTSNVCICFLKDECLHTWRLLTVPQCFVWNLGRGRPTALRNQCQINIGATSTDRSKAIPN